MKVYMTIAYITMTLIQFSTSAIPLFMWSDSSCRHLAPGAAGTSVTADRLFADYLQNIDQYPVVLVTLLEKLGLEELNRYSSLDGYGGGNHDNLVSFRRLRKLMETSACAIHLPAVNAPQKAFNRVMLQATGSYKDNTRVIDSLEELQRLKFHNSSNYIILRNISNHSKQFIGRENKLNNADKFLEEATEILRSLMIPYIHLFTGINEFIKEIHITERQGRDLLVEVEKFKHEDKEPISVEGVNGTCVLFHFRNLTLYIRGPNKHIVAPIYFSAPKEHPESYCKCDRLHLAVELRPEHSDVRKLVLYMDFKLRKGYWSIECWKVSFCGKDQTNANLNNSRISLTSCDIQGLIPRGYSFHCPNVTLTGNNTNDSVILHFDRIQLEARRPYNNSRQNNEKRFSSPYDCIHSFSPNILMGLLTSAVLLTTLLFGLSMLTAIQVSETFADPNKDQLKVAAEDD